MQRNNLKNLIPIGICFLIANLFIVIYVISENYIYYWDYATYWLKYKHISGLFMESPLKAVSFLIRSIRSEEYNALSVFLLLPANYLMGNERLAYILAITNFFALPAIYFVPTLLKHIHPIVFKKDFIPVQFPIPIIITLIPQIWIPVVLGYIGIGGMLIISLILIISFKMPIEKQKYRNLLLIGALLSLLILFRRWYAYWVVSYFLALIFEYIIRHFHDYRFNIKKYFSFAKKILFLGTTSVTLFFVIATPIAKEMLTTDYSDIYSAYKFNISIFDFFIDILAFLGTFISLFCIIGVFQSIRAKRSRRYAIFLIIQFLIIVLHFSKTQDFHPHHYYLLLPTVIIFLSYFFINTYCNLKKNNHRMMFLMGSFFLLALNFSIVFIPQIDSNIGKARYLFSMQRQYPVIRKDISEIKRLLNTLSEISKDPEETVYVLSSSKMLNDDTIRNAAMMYDDPDGLHKKILYTNHVDKRDGFPHQLLRAKYIILPAVPQYHLNADDQKVIGVIARQIYNQSSIGSCYRKLPFEFTCDGNLKVNIFKKTKKIQPSQLIELSKTFMGYYPDYKNLYEIKTPDGYIVTGTKILPGTLP